MQQKTIQIGEVDVPIIIDGGEEWFPISYISNKVLLRNNKLITKQNKTKYQDHLHKFIIKFGEKNIQESNCIDRKGLIEVLKSTQAARLNIDQRKLQNELHIYLGIDILTEEEIDSEKYNKKWFKEINAYTKDIIEYELKNENVEWIRLCTKCNCHYPLTNKFFNPDKRADKGFNKMCKVCIGHSEQFVHPDRDKNLLNKKNAELFIAVNKDYLPTIMESFLNDEIKRIPDCYKNKDGYLRIVKYLYDKDYINENNLTMKLLMDEYNLNGIRNFLSIEEIYFTLFGDDFYLYKWKYPKFIFKEIELTYEIANKIIEKYLSKHHILIQNIFTYDYDKLFKNCGIRKITNGNSLEFIVQYHQYNYAGYLFNSHAVNYYKKDENVLFDLKYLIEQDMKLEIDKIPLYLTKNVLHKKCNPLYTYIVTKKNGSLFEWVNKLYPNKFIETDFEVNAYREEFGSDTECFIHEILKENFKNVIYNQIHTSRTIEINGMIPDWLIMTDTGVYIVEYFGLYEERSYGENSRVTDYIDKTKRKIEKYKQMNGYRFIFFYPNDIENDFEGCRDIIAKVKENPYLSMV